MTMSRLSTVALILAASISILTSPLQAAGWPSRTVRLIVPFGPGGATDIYARHLAERLGAAFGQSFVVENRPGAGAQIGTMAALQALPDGHTLLVVTSTHTINETLSPKRGYVLLRDFAPVAAFNSTALVLVVPNASPVQNLSDLLVEARRRPGELTFASTGVGTPLHLAGELMRVTAGISWLHVPYSTGGQARTDLLAGRVDAFFDVATNALPMIAGKQVRGLAVTSAHRAPALPNLATIAESGVPDYEVSVLIGLMAPAATPKPVLDQLNAEIGRILSTTKITEDWRALGAEPLAVSADEWGMLLRADIDRWRALIEKRNITVD
jgi:tripartite-type tricarboxylate transporter receptor subunit TctC